MNPSPCYCLDANDVFIISDESSVSTEVRLIYPPRCSYTHFIITINKYVYVNSRHLNAYLACVV